MESNHQVQAYQKIRNNFSELIMVWLKFFSNWLLLSTPNYQKIAIKIKNLPWGTSLVAQWLRIHLPMQGTRVRSLIQEDPTCHGAAKPVRHNY